MNNLQAIINALKCVEAPTQEDMGFVYDKPGVQPSIFIPLEINNDDYKVEVNCDFVFKRRMNKFVLEQYGRVCLRITFPTKLFVSISGSCDIKNEDNIFEEKIDSIIVTLENLLEEQEEEK